jgi:hypothetical protein
VALEVELFALSVASIRLFEAACTRIACTFEPDTLAANTAFLGVRRRTE